MGLLLNQRLGLFSLVSGQYPTQSSDLRTSGSGMTAFSESIVEEAALARPEGVGTFYPYRRPTNHE